MGSLYWDCEIIFKALFSAATAIVLLALMQVLRKLHWDLTTLCLDLQILSGDIWR